MKLTISVEIPTIDVYGQLEPAPMFMEERKVFIDGKQVPDTLAQIFLVGLDTLTDDYIREELMRRLERGE